MRTRCRQHTSLVPGLIGAIGKCTRRRDDALRTIMRTHDGTARVAVSPAGLATRGLTRCRRTRNTMDSTLNGLLTMTRDCPRLRTGRGFSRLRTRLRKARGHVARTHGHCGRTMRGCGILVHSFPGGLFTNVFNFGEGRGFRTRTNTSTTPGMRFWGRGRVLCRWPALCSTQYINYREEYARHCRRRERKAFPSDFLRGRPECSKQ